MIFDQFNNHARYHALSPAFAAGFRFLANFNFSLGDGRYEVEGETAYATVMSYETKVAVDLKHEAHRLYADIQFLVAGEELAYFTPADRLGQGNGYDQVKDYEHYPSPQSPLSFALRAGEFAVFFPGEGHRANCALGPPTPARKVVVKVRV